MGKKCTFVKLTSRTGKNAAEARKKTMRKSDMEKIKKDRLKRLREFNSWLK